MAVSSDMLVIDNIDVQFTTVPTLRKDLREYHLGDVKINRNEKKAFICFTDSHGKYILFTDLKKNLFIFYV